MLPVLMIELLANRDPGLARAVLRERLLSFLVRPLSCERSAYVSPWHQATALSPDRPTRPGEGRETEVEQSGRSCGDGNRRVTLHGR